GTGSALNWLDFAIIVTILWFAITGLTAGMLREVVTLVAVFLGVVLAGRLYARLADDIRIVHDDPRMDQLIAFIAIFGATALAGQIAGSLLKQTASLLLLGPVDRVAGLAFGLLKGLIIVELVLIAFAVFPSAMWMKTAIDTSLLAPLFLDGAPWLLHLLPGGFRSAVHAV
ncbi:MAG TPA: CvpA family protein, partial [Dehalococcoidia bacterium]